jgi:replicative DNA helicase
MTAVPWKEQKQAYTDALVYIQGRKEGRIKSFRTPWGKLNNAGVDGLEWHSLTVIAARPATGKTLIKDQIFREAYEHNKGQNIRILDFQFEMLARVSKVREFCSVLEKPYKYICSTATDGGNLTDADIARLYEHSKQAVGITKFPIDIVENPCTIEQFIKIVDAYMEKYAVIVDGKKTYTKTAIGMDHSLLFKMSKNHSNKTEMLYDLGEAITALKRKYPIAFIMLSQLGRHVESPERNEDGKYGNYILETDVFGGDALMQHADMVIGLNRPALKFISYYGPDRYIIDNDNILVAHFLKCRNGDTRMSFFTAEFDKMRISEMNTPAQQKISTHF